MWRKWFGTITHEKKKHKQNKKTKQKKKTTENQNLNEIEPLLISITDTQGGTTTVTVIILENGFRHPNSNP